MLAIHATNATKTVKKSIVKIRSCQDMGPTVSLYLFHFASAVALSAGVGKDLTADFIISQIRNPISARPIRSHVPGDAGKKYHISLSFLLLQSYE